MAHALCYYIPVTKKKPSASHLAATLDRVEYSDLRGWNSFCPLFHLLQGKAERLIPMKLAHGSAQAYNLLWR